MRIVRCGWQNTPDEGGNDVRTGCRGSMGLKNCFPQHSSVGRNALFLAFSFRDPHLVHSLGGAATYARQSNLGTFFFFSIFVRCFRLVSGRVQLFLNFFLALSFASFNGPSQ